VAGLDLILNASRESMACQDADSGHRTEFERMAYINGAQHVLQGLPRDLRQDEAAMLRRAMPTVLGSSIPTQAAGGGQDTSQEGSNIDGGAGGCNRNKVHSLTLLFINSAWLLGAWTVRLIRACGSRAMRAEHEQQYLVDLLSAMARLMEVTSEMLRQIGECWPCRALFVSLEYVADGVRDAVEEFEFGGTAKARGRAEGGCRAAVQN
jgi:hypothetical protein